MTRWPSGRGRSRKACGPARRLVAGGRAPRASIRRRLRYLKSHLVFEDGGAFVVDGAQRMPVEVEGPPFEVVSLGHRRRAGHGHAPSSTTAPRRRSREDSLGMDPRTRPLRVRGARRPRAAPCCRGRRTRPCSRTWARRRGRFFLAGRDARRLRRAAPRRRRVPRRPRARHRRRCATRPATASPIGADGHPDLHAQPDAVALPAAGGRRRRRLPRGARAERRARRARPTARTSSTWPARCADFLDQEPRDASWPRCARCHALGIPLPRLPSRRAHGRGRDGRPGRARAQPRPRPGAHATGCAVMPLLEVTAGQGSCLGHRFEHLAEILDRVRAPDAARRLPRHLPPVRRRLRHRDRRGLRARRCEPSTASSACRKLKAIHLNDSKKGAGQPRRPPRARRRRRRSASRPSAAS